jgi:AcrR family transcriptional regulator
MTSLRHNPVLTGPAGPTAGERAPRDLYLDAARDCILDVGWRRTTLTEVARRAGVSRMTIYRTWADMPTLLGDLMTREWAGTVAGRPAGSGSALERLVEELTGAVRTLRENELFVRIVELDPELILPYLFARRGRSQDLVLELVAEVIAEGQREGTVRAGDPTTMARGVVLTLHGFVLSVHTMVDDAVSTQALDDELATVLGRSLAA